MALQSLQTKLRFRSLVHVKSIACPSGKSVQQTHQSLHICKFNPTSKSHSHLRRLRARELSRASFSTLLLLSQKPYISQPLLLFNLRQHSSDSEAELSDTEEEKMEILQKPTLSISVKKAKADAIWGLFIADALAMPVHWYYNPDDIKRDYGKWLTGYVAPKSKHPSSILTLSAVEGSGRGSTASKNSLIGNVILHDKLEFWNGKNRNNHYHQGMAPGDNTLNAVMVLHELQMMNSVDHDLVKSDQDVRGAVLEGYVSFMTKPKSHNDTYAESFHRSFFKDWINSDRPTTSSELLEFAQNRYREKLQERSDSQLLVIGSFVPAIPWIVRNAHKSEDECAQGAVDFIKLTHPVQSLIPFVDVYARLLHAVLNGKDLKAEVLRVLSNSILGGPEKRNMVLNILDRAEGIPKGTEKRLHMYQSATSVLGSACYIEGAFSSLLFLALEFHDDFQGGVLANANCGGENCHRGAALGALLAASASNKGQSVPSELKDGLGSLRQEIVQTVQDMNEGF